MWIKFQLCQFFYTIKGLHNTHFTFDTRHWRTIPKTSKKKKKEKEKRKKKKRKKRGWTGLERMDLKFKFVHFAIVVLFLVHLGESQNATFDITKYGAKSDADISEVSHEFYFFSLSRLILIKFLTYYIPAFTQENDI